MATVRFTDALIDKIKDKARDMFAKPMNEAENYGIPADIGDQLYNWMFGDHVQTMKSLPVGYLDMVGNMQVAQIANVQVHSQFKFSSPVPWPSKIVSNSRVTSRSWNQHENLHITVSSTDLDGIRFLGIFEARDLKIKDVQFRRDKFINDVHTICTSYATLAPALKAFPALWDLLPDDTKQRHLQVTERKAAPTPAELSVDLGSLTATVVASKMMR